MQLMPPLAPPLAPPRTLFGRKANVLRIAREVPDLCAHHPGLADEPPVVVLERYRTERSDPPAVGFDGLFRDVGALPDTLATAGVEARLQPLLEHHQLADLVDHGTTLL